MKKRNEGFTLVELVIAIVILAIAVSPLLSNFIQSSKLNLKSRKQLNALNLAQDIMEGMSQYTAQDNAEFYYLASVSDNSILESKRVLPIGTSLTSCGGQVYTTSNPMYTGIGAGNPMPKDWKSFIYTINGVETAVGNYNNYDITVKIDSKEINTNVDAGNYTSEEVAEAINGKDYASIVNVDRYFDCVYNIKYAENPTESEEYIAIKNLIQKSNIPSKTVADYKGKITREITISITDEGIGGNHDYLAQVETEYRVLDTYKNELGFTGPAANSNIVKGPSSGSLSQAESNVMPRSIYLYFDGLNGASTTNPETIKIINTTGNLIDVYLIRTVEDGTLAQPSVVSYNNSYACNVYVESMNPLYAKLPDSFLEYNGLPIEDRMELYPSLLNSDEFDVAFSKKYTEDVNIISNLRYNLCFDTNKRVYKEGTVEKLDGISDTDVSTTHYVRGRSLIYYKDSTLSMAAIGDRPDQTEDFYSKHVSDGYKKIQKDVLYDVLIEIREHGKSNVIATYTGGLSN